MWYNDSIGGHDRHIRAKLLRMHQASPESVRYATDRTDEKVKFTDEALMTVQAVPCVFLPLVLKGCMDRARENGVELITAEHMRIINDKRTKEKNNPFSRKEFFHV
jgi:hypothetical protein